ncbi:MAG: hypothetical protein QNJ17_02430 [Desulfocapsaceae bacterium]|nr:hypothetical protein [Desulfocapsaceae bacterium]
MNTIQITDWHIFQRDGEQFLKTAQSAFIKRSKGFSPEVIYNLTCMGIEKLIMAFLMQRGDLAENHTMVDLLRALERHLGINHELDERLRFLDSFQEICDLDTYVVKKPTGEDLREIVSSGAYLQSYLSPLLKQAC